MFCSYMMIHFRVQLALHPCTDPKSGEYKLRMRVPFMAAGAGHKEPRGSIPVDTW